MATVRKARKSDLKDVEYVCRMTAGNLARTNDIIGEATAKTYSTYYIRECLDTCFVLADGNNKPVGYILCEPDYKRFRKIFRKTDVPAIKKIYEEDGKKAWFLPVPYTLFGIKYPAHLHIDILDEYQNKGYGTLLLQALLTELENVGVKPIEALGQEFDPNFHNAVMQVESEEFESGIVAQEFMKGYMYRDSVVRHSMVGVVS